MEQRARDVLKFGDQLFEKKSALDSLWQEIALNFYPERADFTTKRNDGDEFADHLFSSYPVLARRELGNLFAASLRPSAQKWFSIHVDEDNIDEGDAERQFLEYLTNIQWRAMYDPAAAFVTETKQADHDFATFGNAVLKVTPNLNYDGLLFRNYHLRDCAWAVNAENKIDCLYRKWNPTARQLNEQFPDKISSETRRAAEKEPNKEIACKHVVMPSRLYKYENKYGRKFPFVSLYVECESETVLEEVGQSYFCYVVPRWHTISGSAYATSMATAIALPDGRTNQIITRTLRETAEKHVDPPMIAVTEAIRGDIALYAGGVTTAAMEYDERLGEVLRPITRDKSGFPIGLEIAVAIKQDIREAFFLDKLQLPETNKDMTAFEVRRRIEEHIRSASPIFEPIEKSYSNAVCETAFKILLDGGAFPMGMMPDSLNGMETHFTFRSPLADLADAQEAEIYLDVRDRILIPAAQIDPAQLENVDWTEANRAAMRGLGWKAKWFKPKEAVEKKQQELAQAAMMQKGVEAMGAAGQVAEQGGKGAQALQEAGIG